MRAPSRHRSLALAYKAIEQQLQDAIQARDQFLSIASHELKTSLQLRVEILEAVGAT